MGGWVWVLYLVLAPCLSLLESCCGGREGGEEDRRNIVGPASIPLLLARPRKVVPEKGEWRGGNLPWYPPHPRHGHKAQKVRGWDGSGGGGWGRGEPSHHYPRMMSTRTGALSLAKIFLMGRNLPFFVAKCLYFSDNSSWQFDL